MDLFMWDNIEHLYFRNKEQEGIPWCNKIQNQPKIELGKTFNLHPNSTYTQDVWSLNQFYTYLFKIIRE